MQVMTRTKKFESWKARTAAIPVAIPAAAPLGAAIRGATAIREAGVIRVAGILGAGIPGAAIRVVILEAILAGAGVIRTQGVEVEDPPGDLELPGRTLKPIQKCSRCFTLRTH